MKIEQLLYLRDAVMCGSISAAAEKNFMSQSHFSKEIIKLENELGTTLLIRTKNGVMPTAAYKNIEDKINDVLNAISDIKAICKGEGHERKLKIVANYAINDMYFDKIISYINKRGKKFSLSIEKMSNSKIIESFEKGSADFAIIADWFGLASNAQNNSTFFFKKISEDESTLYVGQKSSYWSKKCISIDQLVELPLITMELDEQRERSYYLKIANSAPNHVFLANDLNVAMNCLARTEYCLVNLKSLGYGNPYIENGSVRSIPICGLDHKTPIFLMYLRNRKLKDEDIKFIEYCEKAFAAGIESR